MKVKKNIEAVQQELPTESLIEQIIEQASGESKIQNEIQPLVGECVDERHPTLSGRVLLRWKSGDQLLVEKWVPCLQGVTVRKGDRVLVQKITNWPEPIVIGVVDGFANRPDHLHRSGPSISLKGDESLRIDSQEGQPLVEIFQEEQGPVVRLLSADVNLDLAGHLKINAESIEFAAHTGDVKITASDDVTVKGEMINLN